MGERAWEGVRSGQFMHPGCCHKLWQTDGPGKKVPQGLCFSPRFFGSFLKSNFQQILFSIWVQHFHPKPLHRLDWLCCEKSTKVIQQGAVSPSLWHASAQDLDLILRLKATLFTGGKILMQFLVLPFYNLYLFAIHQTPSSLCISRLLIYRICSVCSKQQEEGPEMGFTSDSPTLQMIYMTLIFPIQWNTLKWAEGICSLGTLLGCWACQRYMHTPKMLWHSMQPHVLEVGRCLFKYGRIMGSFQLFGTVVIIFTGSFSYISV